MTAESAHTLYALACVSHKRADWRRAAHALAEALETGQRLPCAAEPHESAVARPLAAQSTFKGAPTGLHVANRPQPVARLSRGKTLIQFLAERGIRDDGGEISALDGQVWHRQRGGRRKLIRDDGLGIEEAAERAFDAGYFWNTVAPDDGSQPVSEAELLESIRQELAGRPIYAGEPDDDRYHALEPFEREAMQ